MADPKVANRRAAESRGHRSEALAAWWLRLKGHRILGRRVKTHAGEIDLITLCPFGPVCFVEVKARSNLRDAAEAVTQEQRTRIARAASLYLASRPALARRGARFDIITVAGLPRHLRDAWRMDG
ncbi:MAG TPA: YraN family protein [Rhizomicrobium sp.]|jgi:putative endonuclease|nr:YraN family protein [Rhizomicrobium sp.]